MPKIIVLCPKCESNNLIFQEMYKDEEKVYFQCEDCDALFSLNQAVFEFEKHYKGRAYPYRKEETKKEVR